MAMKFLNSWPPDRSAEKRKHGSVESPLIEKDRKKFKAQSGVVDDRDYAGSRDGSQEPLSPFEVDRQQNPLGRNPLPSPPIHPDRQHIFNHKSISNHSTSNIYPPTPVSRSPEHIPDGSTSREHKSPSILDHQQGLGDAKSRRPPIAPSHPRLLQIDTSRAIKELDPRSPGYVIRGLASKEERDKTYDTPRNSRDPSRLPFDSPSRRQSEIMPPPLSASIKPPRSESSTPVIRTPVSAKESMDLVSAEVNPLSRKTSVSGDPMSGDPNLSTNANEMTLPKSVSLSKQPPISQGFIGFAQSIMATTSVKMKLESVRELTTENVKESRRQEKHTVAYASLVDLTSSNCEAIQRARTKLEKQFERYSMSQDLIANRLEVPDAKRPVSRPEDAADNISDEITKDIKSLQRELREVKRGLEDHKDKAVRHRDLEKFARKTASLADIEQLVTKDELLQLREELLGPTSQLKHTENEISGLVTVTSERYNRAQETQEKIEKRFQDLSSEASASRNTCNQRFSSTQARIADLKDGFGALSKDLETTAGAWKGESTVLREELEHLRGAQTKNEIFIHGDPNGGQSGLVELIEKCSQEVSQLKTLAIHLEERVNKLDEKIIASSQEQSVSTVDTNGRDEHVESVRQHVTEVSNTTDELRREFDIIADDFGAIQQGLAKLKEDFDLSKGAEEKARPHSTQPVPSSDHVKLEKIENDLQSLSLFTKTQQLKFDNLTTEDLTRNIIHQTKQLYKEHPGIVYDRLRILEGQQRTVDGFIMTTVQPRLLSLEAQINLRAGTDALNHLNSRVQTLETIHNRKELSGGVTYPGRTSIGLDQEFHDSEIHATVATLSKELHELESKHTELDKRARDRHERLRGDIEILNREIYAGAAGNRHKEAQLESSLKYKDLIEVHNDDNDHPCAKRFKSVQPIGGTNSRAPTASMSSSRQESVATETVRPESAGSVSAAVSETSMTELQQRKRKRPSQSRISDDEGNCGNDLGHRAAGKGP